MGKGFIQWIKEPVEGVTPIAIGPAIGIGLALAAVDFFIPLVLIIAGLIFIAKGHRKMGIFLVVLNVLIPDDLPIIDEILGIVLNYASLYKKYKKVATSAVKAIDSMKQ